MRQSKSTVISIVTPCFNEAENIGLVYAALCKALDPAGIKWEWIVIDDHSSDGSPLILQQLNKTDPRVGTLRLASRAGSHRAIRCGLREANGACAVILSCDLQDSTEVIPKLFQEWQKGVSIVWATREQHHGNRGWNSLLSLAFYSFIRNYVGVSEMPQSGSDFVLIDRSVLNTINLHGEHRLNLFALISWIGFTHSEIGYQRTPRKSGKSKWTFRAKIGLVADTVAGFSNQPFRAVLWCGVFSSACGMATLSTLFFSAVRSQHLSLAVVSGLGLMLTGISWIFLSKLGDYLQRILREAQGRPLFVVESKTLPTAELAKLAG